MKGNHDVVIQTPNSKAKAMCMIKKKYIDRKRGAGRNEKEALAHALPEQLFV